MTESSGKPRNPVRVAIVVLGVALVVMAAIIAFLVWGRSTPTITPSPSPSSATSPAATAAPTVIPVDATPSRTPSHNPVVGTTAPGTTSGASPSTAPAKTPAPSEPAVQTMMWEGKATFEHFTVEVLSEDADQGADGMVDGKAGLLVEVCVIKALDDSARARITTDPWTLEDSDNNVQTPQKVGHEPAFPADGEYAVGECARGFLTFDYVSVDSDYAVLVYDNALGDRAVWQFH